MTLNRNIETEFINSWAEIDTYFKDLSTTDTYEFCTPLIEVIQYLCDKKYDKIFRAGQSMWILFLSRSIEYGLREDQHRIGINPTHNKTFEVFYSNGEKEILSFEATNLVENEQFLQLLAELEKQPIN